MRRFSIIAVVFSLVLSPVFGAGTGTMTVKIGFVGGKGSISGTVNVAAAGSLQPGATEGTLNIDGALDLSAMADGGSGKVAFGLVAPVGINDQISAAGTLSIGTGKLGFGDFTFTDLGGVEPGNYTLITSNGISGSLDASNLIGTINGHYGTIGISSNNVILSVNTLIGSAIVDDKSAGPVDINSLVTYAVTFSKDMDAGTVTAADFGNAGTAQVTIGTLIETSPGVFSVPVTPITAGTLRLKVNDVAVLTDVDGKNSVTSPTILDDTTITVRTAYETWANGYLPIDVSNPVGNNDGDSLINLLEFAFGTNPTTATSGTITYVPNGEVTSPGLSEARNLAVGSGEDYRAVFGRRKDYLVAGLTYTVQFSASLDTWVDSTDTPTRLSDANSSGPIDAVSVPYPLFITTTRGNEKPTFFRIAVTLTP